VNPNPLSSMTFSRTFLSISLKAASTASVFVAKPCASITRASSASSMCMVIFMPYPVWQAGFVVNDRLVAPGAPPRLGASHARHRGRFPADLCAGEPE